MKTSAGSWVAFIGLSILVSVEATAQSFTQINKYQVNYALANDGNRQFIALRSFSDSGIKFLLLLDPISLQTKVDIDKRYQKHTLAWANVLAIFKNTTYVKALEAAAAKDQQLQNAGIDHAIPNENGITLTIDLCPSHRPLDRVIFHDVFEAFKTIEKTSPLAISLSGKWMLKHQTDLDWLKQLALEKELDITWINHSYNHEVNTLPLAENFLLASGTNLDIEVLKNEKSMLKNGLTPSIFFRFPGLVSDQSIVGKIESYGLIPVGSDAWLAKGQQPVGGSIVLIHGNGNEELGVQDFIRLLKNKSAEVKNKQWLLFDLRQGLEKEFQ